MGFPGRTVDPTKDAKSPIRKYGQIRNGLFATHDRRVLAVGLGVVGVVTLTIAVGLDVLNFDVIVGLLTLLVLVLITIPMLRWVARVENNPRLLTIMYWGFGLKIVFTLVRYFVITVVYSDNGDAGVYSAGGAILMDLYRRGIFVLEVPELATRGAETNRIAVVVGLIYMVTGYSRYAASFVFSWLCFLGQILMIRAFARGVPDGDLRRYASLVLLFPSMLFWPSSIGKEALMVFSVGLASYGAAQLLGSQVKATGIGIFALGTAGLFFIRPHMSLIAILALGFAAAVSTVVGFSSEKDKKASSRGFAVRVIAVVILIAGAGVATTQLSEVLGDGADGGLSGVLARTKGQTAEGGSQFVPPAVSSPAQIPMAILTVLFRPFPWEAHSMNSLIASGEGLLLAGLFAVSRRRALQWIRSIAKRPYLVYGAAYALAFIFAFSYIGNFGILARQRTQMIPLALLTLAMPVAPRRPRFRLRGRQPRNVDAADEDDGADEVDEVHAHPKVTASPPDPAQSRT